MLEFIEANKVYSFVVFVVACLTLVACCESLSKAIGGRKS